MNKKIVVVLFLVIISCCFVKITLASPSNLKVMTWNLLVDGGEHNGIDKWSNGRGARVIQFIKDHPQDILLLQEFGSDGKTKMDNDLVDALKEVYPYRQYAISLERDNIPMYNAIFSRYPMTNRGTEQLVINTNDKDPRWKNSCAYATIKGVRVYSCHLPPAYYNTDRQEEFLKMRKEAADTLKSKIDIKNVIIGGDFNDGDVPPGKGIQEYIYSRAKGTYKKDCTNGWIDHIFSDLDCGQTTTYLSKWDERKKYSDHAAKAVVINIAKAIRADVNQDNKINHIDVLLIARHYAGLNIPPENWHNSSTTGDVNCDDKVNHIDVLLVARHYAGLSIPPENWCEGE